MTIDIEIGTEQQKNLILSEVESIICGYVRSNKYDELVEKIIIPNDFDSVVRSIVSDDTYKSDRFNINHKAMAKTMWHDNIAIIVFSPFLFTEKFDTQVRSVIYFHEICHAIVHPNVALHKDKKINKKAELEAFIFSLYEEYFANRKSLEIVDVLFKKKSKLLQEHVRKCRIGHYENLQNEDLHYKVIKNVIYNFKFNRIDFNNASSAIFPLINSFSIDLFFYFSYIDHLLSIKTELIESLENVKFYNQHAKDLICLFREKYKESQIRLENRLQLIEDYLLNFGVKFEDIEAGLFCWIDFI